MAGSPKRRARAEAQMIRMGITPLSHADARRKAAPTAATASARPAQMVAQIAAALDADSPAADAAADALLTEMATTISDTNTVFERLRGLALDQAVAIMDLPLDPDSKHFSKLLTIKTAITTAVLTATARVRPGDLRDKDEDGVGQLLEEVRRLAAEDPYVLDPQERAREELLN